jgi:hypothetical protein
MQRNFVVVPAEVRWQLRVDPGGAIGAAHQEDALEWV